MSLLAFHSTYLRLTNGTARFSIWEREWHAFSQHYSVDDLRCYLEYLIRENKRMNGAAYSLSLHRILDSEYKHFDATLSCARAAERNRRVVTPREQVLQRFNPVVGEVAPNNVVSFKDALKKAVVNL